MPRAVTKPIGLEAPVITITWFARGLSEIAMTSKFKQNLHQIIRRVKLNTTILTQANFFHLILTEIYIQLISNYLEVACFSLAHLLLRIMFGN